eukprot:SAG31_NODE_23157_length_510_cov_0.722628_1_plen_110_part_01
MSSELANSGTGSGMVVGRGRKSAENRLGVIVSALEPECSGASSTCYSVLPAFAAGLKKKGKGKKAKKGKGAKTKKSKSATTVAGSGGRKKKRKQTKLKNSRSKDIAAPTQ